MIIGKIEIPEYISEGHELLKADGFDYCCVGIMERFGQAPVLCYDKDMMIRQMVEDDGMSEEEALEFFEFNIIGAFVGEYTPCFVTNGVFTDVDHVQADAFDKNADIYVGNVGINKLRSQRNLLLRHIDRWDDYDRSLGDGLISLLDYMLDKAEGFPKLPSGQMDELVDVWNVQSLEEEFPGYSDTQYRMALFMASDKYDANYGVCYDTFKVYLDAIDNGDT